MIINEQERERERNTQYIQTQKKIEFSFPKCLNNNKKPTVIIQYCNEKKTCFFVNNFI